MTPPAVVLRDVTLRHGGVTAVSALSGAFPPGSLTAVTGENGAGKTTLLRAIAGLHPVASGSIDRGGLRASRIALLPQLSSLDRTFPVTCADVATMGLIGRAGPFRAFTRAERDGARAALEEVGMAAFAGRAIGELSAGQFQRVLFARLLVQDAPVLLLDEPFAAVDQPTQALLMDVIARLHAQGRTVAVVLHDADLARRAFPQTLNLSRGGFFWGETEAQPVRQAA